MNKMKPATILQNIVRDAEREKLEIPLIKDVYNFLNTLQKKTVGKSNMTLGELAKFCIHHMNPLCLIFRFLMKMI